MSHIATKSSYFGIFGLLMVLTALTVGAAFTDLGALNFPVAIAIAITKATVVILFFMHGKYASKLTQLFIGTSFFFLLILFGLTLTDYLSRGMRTYPGGTAGAGYGVRVELPGSAEAPEGAHEAGH